MQEINRKRWSRSSGREKQKEDLNGRARPPDYREYQLSQKEWMQYLIMGAGAAGLCAYTFYPISFEASFAEGKILQSSSALRLNFWRF